MTPFLIGVYAGNGKPLNFKEYLKPLVDDWIQLDERIKVQQKNFSLKMGRWLLDLPARTEVCCIKFLGYHGCPKCTVIGTNIGTTVYFPGKFKNRTDESFVLRLDPIHHKPDASQRSILESIKVGMISNFPLDPMHTLDEGATQKFLDLLKNKKKLFLNFKNHHLDAINNSIELASNTQPSEFNRKIRSLDFLRHWKATEYRTFLLYVGPVVLKQLEDFNDGQYYQNFLKLSIAARMCSHHNDEIFCDIADKMFNDFSDQFTDLFGVNNTTWKIHAVRHLAEESKVHGPLYSYSVYDFENFIQTIKKSLHSHRLPLQQLHRRVVEIYESNLIFKSNNTNDINIKKKKGKNISLQYNGNIIGVDFKDSWFLTKEKEIVKILEIISNPQIKLKSSILLRKHNLFEAPVTSSILDIFTSDGECSGLKFLNLSDIKCKMFCIKMESEKYAFIPMSEF